MQACTKYTGGQFYSQVHGLTVVDFLGKIYFLPKLSQPEFSFIAFLMLNKLNLSDIFLFLIFFPKFA